MTQFTLDQLLAAVNAAGFADEQELQDWIRYGRLLVAISRLQTTNGVLDAQTAGMSQANEQAKQQNNAQIAALQAELAAIVG